MFFPSLVEWNITNFIIRILASLFLGALIGLDRGIKRRGAGAKTCTVLCLGATLVMLTAQYMEVYFPDKADMARLAAQVISGIGFLGVGTIIITGKHQVKGLTTAASLWTCACIGLACGIGFVDGAVIITICVLFALHVLAAIEVFLYKKSNKMTLIIETSNDFKLVDFITGIKELNIKIDNFDIEKIKKEKISILFLFLLLPDNNKEIVFEYIYKVDGIIRFEEI